MEFSNLNDPIYLFENANDFEAFMEAMSGNHLRVSLLDVDRFVKVNE